MQEQSGPYHEQNEHGIPNAFGARDGQRFRRSPEEEPGNAGGDENARRAGLVSRPAQLHEQERQ